MSTLELMESPSHVLLSIVLDLTKLVQIPWKYSRTSKVPVELIIHNWSKNQIEHGIAIA